jgi:hypothetical protein
VGNVANDVLPQLQLAVLDGSQYAALAKYVNGAKALICGVLSGVIACRFTAEARKDQMDARAKTVRNQVMCF